MYLRSLVYYGELRGEMQFGGNDINTVLTYLNPEK